MASNYTVSLPPPSCTLWVTLLCELFLGCEAHFELWRKLFCLVPRNQGGSIFEVGGAEVWRIAGTEYLSGTLKKASEEWPSEWFYIDDVALSDPV